MPGGQGPFPSGYSKEQHDRPQDSQDTAEHLARTIIDIKVKE